ncbi:MAG: S8 family serine peptidase [Verrucomicrobiae bacterium]|nr:S8 family serine peptidase [Verrucomicrobiae bacterium]
MQQIIQRGWLTIGLWLGLGLLSASGASGTNLLVWNKQTDRVDADVRGWELASLLERVSAETGWQVYLEPDTQHRASVKFRNLASGDALRSLLGDLNFALVPQTNAAARLYVFRTGMHKATRLIRPDGEGSTDKLPRRVPNQLIVRLKPGADIDAWARMLGAKVIGRIPELDAYLLEFPDAAAVEAARLQLSDGSDIASVDYNYYIDAPQPARGLLAASNPPLSLQLKPPGNTDRVIVGLIDTGVQPMSGSLADFFLKQISVAGEALLDPSSPSHGTAMAETILRSLELVTKGSTSVQILPVDVYGSNAETTSWNVARGILEAVNGGATVINLSLGGGGDSQVLRDMITSVSARGIPIYAAAGNEPVATPFFPAAYPEVIAVTAGEQGRIADYANFGSFVDVAAPDASVVYYGNRPWYVRGTSAAAAYTSGMAAGLADTTQKSWQEIQAIIQQNFPVPGK